MYVSWDFPLLQISQTDATVNLGQRLWSSVADLDGSLHHAGGLGKLSLCLSVDQGERLVSLDALPQADKVGQTDCVIELVASGATATAMATTARPSSRVSMAVTKPLLAA